MESVLEKLSQISLNNDNVDDDVVFALKQVVDLWVEFENDDDDIVLAILRTLRNVFAKISPELKRTWFIQHPELFDLPYRILTCDPPKIYLLPCTLQYLFNACQQQVSEFYIEFWNRFGILVLNLISRDELENNVRNYASALLYTRLSHDSTFIISRELIKRLLKMCVKEESEFALLCVKSSLTSSSIWTEIDTEDRRIALDIVLSDTALSVSLSTMIAEDFRQRSREILINGSHPEDAEETLKMLEVLCTASSSSTTLQEDSDLLIHTVILLKAIHDLGKSGDDRFRPIRKYAEETEQELSKPLGLKRDLIRLIGNLTYENTRNQDLIRQSDGIPLLLDCSSLDSKNPYITQWVIFAIRNVMLRNPENQRVLAEMEKNGKLDKHLLMEAGVIIH